MSALLWIDTGRDEALSLGDPFALLGAFAEMARAAGDRYDEFADLFGVPEQVMDGDDADPDWLAGVRGQAGRFRAEFGDALGEAARAVLDELAPDAPTVTKAAWDPELHPRADDGTFVDANHMHAAMTDPAKAAELRAKVTKPAERAKLDAAISPPLPKRAVGPEGAEPKGEGEPGEKPREGSAAGSHAGEPRAFASGDDADAWGREHFGDWAKSLTRDEHKAVGRYRFSDYRPINAALRGAGGKTDGPEWEASVGKLDRPLVGAAGAKSAPAEVAKAVADMDAALAKATVPEDVTVHRGVTGAFAAGLKPGAQFTDPAYGSTSLAVEAADNYAAGETVLRVRVPAGTHAAYVTALEANKGHEQELLLPRGCTYKITGESNEGGTRVLTAELVPPGKPEPEPHSEAAESARRATEGPAAPASDLVRYINDLKATAPPLATIRAVRGHLEPLSAEQVAAVARGLGHSTAGRGKREMVDKIVASLEGIRVSRDRQHQIATGEPVRPDDPPPEPPAAETPAAPAAETPAAPAAKPARAKKPAAGPPETDAGKAVAALYDRAASATDADVEAARAHLAAMPAAEVARVAAAVGMVGKVKAADVLARIADRHGAAVRRKLIGRPPVGEALPFTPAAPQGSGSRAGSPPAAPPVDLADPHALAAAVHAAGRAVPDVFGGAYSPGGGDWYRHKAGVADLYDAMSAAGTLPRGTTLDQFKAALLRAHAADTLDLGRHDLSQLAADPDRHELHATHHPSGAGVFHVVNVPPA